MWFVVKKMGLAPLENGDCTGPNVEQTFLSAHFPSHLDGRQECLLHIVGRCASLEEHPLSQTAICTQIPQLQARGVTVLFDGVCNGYTVAVQLYGNGSASAVCNYNQSGQYVNTTLTATPDAGWRFAWWQGMSAPWNGAVVTYTANTSVTFTGEPRGRTLRAVFVPDSHCCGQSPDHCCGRSPDRATGSDP